MAPSRRNRRRQSKQRRRQSRRNQSGGAMLAPYSTGDSMLLDAKTLVQSESGSFMKAFAELPSVIPKQMGGSRRRRNKQRRSRRRQSRQRGGMQEFNGPNGAYSTPMGVGMGLGLAGPGPTMQGLAGPGPTMQGMGLAVSGSGQQGGRRQRKQRGGSAPFDSAFNAARPPAAAGMNDQFQTESSMGYGYNEFKGAQ